ncbi:hypothetical protein D3C77_98860 [compost metagenome]
MPPRHLLQPLDLDAGGDGDEQLAFEGAQLGHQRLQHGRHQLGFDRQHYDLGLTGRLGVVLGDANAELVSQLVQLGPAGVGGGDPLGRITGLDQTGNDAAAHVSRPDEGEGSMLHQTLLLLTSQRMPTQPVRADTGITRACLPEKKHGRGVSRPGSCS